MPEHAHVYRWRRDAEAIGAWDDEYPWAVSLDRSEEPLALFSEHAYALGFALALPSMFPELDPLAVHDEASQAVGSDE